MQSCMKEELVRVKGGLALSQVVLVGTGDDAVALKGTPKVRVVAIMGPVPDRHAPVTRRVGHGGDVAKRGQLIEHRAGT